MIMIGIKKKHGNAFFSKVKYEMPGMLNAIFKQTDGQTDETRWFKYNDECFVLSKAEQAIEQMLDADLTKGLMFPLFYNKNSEIGINLNTHKLYHNSTELDYDLMDLLLNYLNTNN